MDSPLLDKSLDFATKNSSVLWNVYDFDELLELADEIKRMLIASIKTTKENNKAERGLWLCQYIIFL